MNQDPHDFKNEVELSKLVYSSRNIYFHLYCFFRKKRKQSYNTQPYIFFPSRIFSFPALYLNLRDLDLRDLGLRDLDLRDLDLRDLDLRDLVLRDLILQDFDLRDLDLRDLDFRET